MKLRWHNLAAFAAVFALCGGTGGTAGAITDPPPSAVAPPSPPAPPDRRPDPGDSAAARATELTTAMEYDKARAELAKADPNSPSVILAKARLALYEEECD